MFIDRLRESSNLCDHPDDAFELDKNGLWIRCRTCPHAVSVVEFLTRHVSPLWSPTLAREFASETGLVDVPCQFRLDQFSDDLLPETIVTRLSTVLRGYDILKAIHSPFIRNRETRIDPRLFRTLMTEYMAVIDRVSSEKDEKGTAEAVQSILTNMKNAFSNVDMFDHYFNVLAPYTKRAAVSCRTVQTEDGCIFLSEDVEKVREAPLGIALDRELAMSAQIRKHFSRYCVPFDVVYAIVLCYMCGDNVNVVYNIVLDITSKLCRGFFSFPISDVFPTGIEIQKFLNRYIRVTENKDLYYHRQKYLQEQGVVDDFSEEFLRRYSEMESDIRKHVPLANSDDKIERFVYHQTFPYMLFGNNKVNDFDYYAFVMALALYASKSTLGSKTVAPGTSVPKGVVAECKHVYRFVKKCMAKVKEFHGKDKIMYWTKDMFELFMASDPNFADELMGIINIMSQGK